MSSTGRDVVGDKVLAAEIRCGHASLMRRRSRTSLRTLVAKTLTGLPTLNKVDNANNSASAQQTVRNRSVSRDGVIFTHRYDDAVSTPEMQRTTIHDSEDNYALHAAALYCARAVGTPRGCRGGGVTVRVTFRGAVAAVNVLTRSVTGPPAPSARTDGLRIAIAASDMAIPRAEVVRQKSIDGLRRPERERNPERGQSQPTSRASRSALVN